MELKIKLLVMLLIMNIASLSFAKENNINQEIIQMYSADNRTITVNKTEQEAYENVGWYIEPVTPMYAADGRVRYTLQSEVEAYKNVGWFLSEREAKESIINEQELLLLAKIIHAEAAPNNYMDKCYVGAVVMNRVESGIWGNSVYSVITAKRQYSSYGNKKFNQYPPEDCLQIAKELLLGERYEMPNNVIFQSGEPQGIGIWKKVSNTIGNSHYYCYGNI